MEDSADMTPREHIDRVDTLLDAEKWREAMAFAATGIETIWPALSTEELNNLTGLMEMSATMAWIEENTNAQLPADPAIRLDDQIDVTPR